MIVTIARSLLYPLSHIERMHAPNLINDYLSHVTNIPPQSLKQTLPDSTAKAIADQIHLQAQSLKSPDIATLLISRYRLELSAMLLLFGSKARWQVATTWEFSPGFSSVGKT